MSEAFWNAWNAWNAHPVVQAAIAATCTAALGGLLWYLLRDVGSGERKKSNARSVENREAIAKENEAENAEVDAKADDEDFESSDADSRPSPPTASEVLWRQFSDGSTCPPPVPTLKESVRRLMQELRQIKKQCSGRKGPITACGLKGNSLAEWIVEMEFAEDTQLGQDLQDYARSRLDKSKAKLKLQVKFPPEFPNSPPEVWVRRPRLRYLTAPVSFGGKVCVDVLTSQGWVTQSSMKDILLGLHAEFLSGGAKVDVPTSIIRGYAPPPPEIGRLQTALFPTANNFNKRLQVLSAKEASAFLGDLPNLEQGDKIILPFSYAKRVYESPDLQMPLMFSLKTTGGRKAHCGLLDFMDGLPDQYVLLPTWLTEDLCVGERQSVQVRGVCLELVTKVKVQPHSIDFYNAVQGSEQPVASLLTDSLRKLSALTEGTSVPILIGDKRLLVEIVALEPQAAVRIIDTNVKQDFEFKVEFDPAPDLEDEAACKKRQDKLLARRRERQAEEAKARQVAEERLQKHRRLAFEQRRDRFVAKSTERMASGKVVNIAFRLPNGEKLSGDFQEGAQITTLMGFVLKSAWAESELPWDVAISFTFPKRTLSEAELVTGEMHRACLSVALIQAPEGAYDVAATEMGAEPADDDEEDDVNDEREEELDEDMLESTRLAFERQRQLASEAGGSGVQTSRNQRVQREHEFLDRAKQFQWEQVKTMLAESPELVNVQPSGRWSALHQAASRNATDIVQHLLDCNADVRLRNRDGRTAADLATDAALKDLLQPLGEPVDGGLIPVDELLPHQQELIDQVVAVCGADAAVAQALLQEHDWNMEETINSILDG